MAWPKPPAYTFRLPTPPRRDSGGGNFFSNLVGDVRDTILGLPRGFKEIFTHPIRTLENIGESYKHTYGPLFSGDFGEFAHRVNEHPLGPILDVATIATLGAGAAVAVPARVGATTGLAGRLARAGSASARAFELTGPGGTTATRYLARNPVTRGQQKVGQHILNLLPDDTPFLGQYSRFTRTAARRELDIPAHGLLSAANRYNRAVSRLSTVEKAAVRVLADGVTPDDYARFLREMKDAGVEVEDAMLKALSNPKLKALVARPNKKIMQAVVEGRRLADLDLELKMPHMTADELVEAMERPFLIPRLMSGARYVSAGQLQKRMEGLSKELRGIEKREGRLEKTLERAEQLTPAMRGTDRPARAANREAAEASTRRAQLRKRLEGADELDAQLDAIKDDLERVSSNRIATEGISQADFDKYGVPFGTDEAARVRLMGRVYDTYIEGVQKFEQRAAARVALLEEEARALRLAERQEHHVGRRKQLLKERKEIVQSLLRDLEQLRGERAALTATRERVAEMVPGIKGGKTIAELRAELQSRGRIEPFYMPHTPTVGPTYGRLKTGRGLAPVRDQLLHQSKGLNAMMGRLALDPSVLSAEFLKTVRQKFAVDAHDFLIRNGKRIHKGEAPPAGWTFVRRSPSESHRSIYETAELREGLAPLVSDTVRGYEGDIFTTHDLAELAGGKDYNIIVPERMVREVVGEYRRGSKVLDTIFAKPTRIWRAIILGYRPAFLVNNVVGNHFLWAIQFAGPAGIHAYVSAALETRGLRAVRRMLDDPEVPREFRRMMLEKHFPDQIHGTFGETQATGIRRLGSGIMPATMAAAETLPRMAGVIRELRRSPEVKSRVASMRGETEAFWKAADAELESNPALRDAISDRVNMALGDYMRLTDFERRYVRGAMPFYAWYRAIFTITLRLPLHTPGRANALRMIGQVGMEKNRDELGDVPSFLLGSIKLDDDELDAISLPFGIGDIDPLPGRQGILTTAGLNPFETFESEMGAIGGLVRGEPGSRGMRELAGGLNPFIQGAIEQVTGEKILTGAPVEGRGGLAGIPLNVAEQLPQLQILFPPKPGEKSLYDKSWQQYFWSSLGLPVRQMHPGTAKFLRQLEEGELRELTIFAPPKKKKGG